MNQETWSVVLDVGEYHRLTSLLALAEAWAQDLGESVNHPVLLQGRIALQHLAAQLTAAQS